MDYDQFDVEYGKFIDNVRALDEAARTAEVKRLRRLVDTVEPATDQEAARFLLMSLDDALGRPVPVLSEAMAAAVKVHSRVRTAEGPIAERIAVIEAGMADIARIAESAAVPEQGAILDLNESLDMLVDSLTITLERGTDTDR